MKNYKKLKIWMLLLIFCPINALLVKAQDTTVNEDGELVQEITIKTRALQRVGNTFESVWLIDNQTVHVPYKGTFEFDIQHRFGTVDNGYDDFWGLYAPSNIRLGIGFVPVSRLLVGIGITKENMLWDVFGKYAILKQEDNYPVSISYYANMAADTRRSQPMFSKSSDRFSYFHQLMVARKLTQNLSLQTSFNYSHFNTINGDRRNNGDIVKTLDNDHFSLSFLGRYKLTDALGLIGNVDQPLTQHRNRNPQPNVSFGIEIATPLHAFQVFVGNYKSIVQQYSNVFNQNDYTDGEFLIGFTITRLLDTKMESFKKMLFKKKVHK